MILHECSECMYPIIPEEYKYVCMLCKTLVSLKVTGTACSLNDVFKNASTCIVKT